MCFRVVEMVKLILKPSVMFMVRPTEVVCSGTVGVGVYSSINCIIHMYFVQVRRSTMLYG